MPCPGRYWERRVRKTSSSVDRNKVRSGMGTYMETEEVKNVVQYKAKPAEAKNKDKR